MPIKASVVVVVAGYEAGAVEVVWWQLMEVSHCVTGVIRLQRLAAGHSTD